MNRRTFIRSALASVTAAALPAVLAATATSAQAATPGALLWSEDFTGPAGAAPDPANWAFQIGRYGAPHEHQYYTASSRNACLNGYGALQITPRHEPAPDGQPSPNDYTSARLVTRGLHQFSPPVRIQANIRVPAGFGIMPAFWALGADPARPESWPHEGEIDIMEAIRVGYPTSWLPQTVHGPAIGSDTEVSLGNTYRGTIPLDGGFHRYGIDWYTDHIDFHLDGIVIFTVTQAAFTALGGDWTPFSGAWPIYLLLNVAVIGSDPTTIVTQPMLVDWVRAWSLV